MATRKRKLYIYIKSWDFDGWKGIKDGSQPWEGIKRAISKLIPQFKKEQPVLAAHVRHDALGPLNRILRDHSGPDWYFWETDDEIRLCHEGTTEHPPEEQTGPFDDYEDATTVTPDGY